MVNTKKLVALARKWQKKAAMGRKRISVPRSTVASDSGKCSIAAVKKGHFVVYSIDGRRYVVPLAYLNNPIFTELFEMSKEEFGLPGDRPIILPFDAIFMDYVVSLIRRRMSIDVEKALLTSIATGRCSMSSSVRYGQKYQTSPFLPVYGF